MSLDKKECNFIQKLLSKITRLRHPVISHSLFAWILLNKSKINQSVDYALWATKNTQFVREKMNKEM